MLPLLLRRIIILAVVCFMAAGMIAFCAGKWQEADTKLLRIGYVSLGDTAEESMLMDLAVSYVQDMESVKSLCSLEQVSSEQEGVRMMEEGTLAALVVLPEDVINEILSGSNTPAKLYLPERSALEEGGFSAVGSMLFQELANAAIGMLGTAQAEIYASSAILNQLSVAYDGGMLQTAYDKINQFNLGVVAARENLFDVKSLSVTEKDTYAVYYGSALFAVYLLLAGLFFEAYCKRSRLEQVLMAKKLGIGCMSQLLSKCAAGVLLMLIVTLFPFLFFLIPAVNAVLSVEFSTAGVAVLFFIIVFTTIYHVFLYQLADKYQSALIMIGLTALIQAYLSGCIIPTVLLPEYIAAIGKWLPAAFLKAGFTIVLTGETQGWVRVAGGLLFWGLLLLMLTWLLMRMEVSGAVQIRNSSAGRLSDKSMHIPSIPIVLFRRLLSRKSIWVCMGLVVLLSAVIVGVEKSSKTQITVAVYDCDGSYGTLLEAYQGLVRFENYDSEEAVKKAVLKGAVECGYILPEGLAENIIARRANHQVTVYRDADAVAVPVVNEVIFERIFRTVSLKWYEDYISLDIPAIDKTALRETVAQAFAQQLEADTTFAFEMVRIGVEQGQDTDAGPTYPVLTVAVVTVLLCIFQGLLQVVEDIRKRRFYKRNRLAMAVLTVALPVILGLLTGFLTIVFVKMQG